MRVVLVSHTDWANVGYVFQECLRSVGVDAEALTLNVHPFGYEKAARVVNLYGVQAAVSQSNIVIHMHSRDIEGVQYNGQFRVVFHGGSAYRRNSQVVNRHFNPFVALSLIQTGDLLGLGARNEAWLLPAVDTRVIRPDLGIWGDKVKIGHFPRHPDKKGSVTFRTVIDRLRTRSRLKDRFEFVYADETLPWRENLRRLAACDIYLEQFVSTLEGKPLLNWGVTALEAAALGKIVVTNFSNYDRYLLEYGPCALQCANTEEQLERVLTKLILMSHADLEKLQVESRLWVERRHSLQSIGKRLQRALQRFCTGHDQKVRVRDKTAENASPVPKKRNDRRSPYDPLKYWSMPLNQRVKITDQAREEHKVIARILKKHGLINAPILEIGSGHGNTYRLLTSLGLTFANYRMVDFVESARKVCRAVTGIKPDLWDGKSLPYDPKEFDLAISTDVMLHVPPEDFIDFIAEHVRISKRFLLISTYLGKVTDALPDHCFRHDYQAAFRGHRLETVEFFDLEEGRRRIWLLRKPQ